MQLRRVLLGHLAGATHLVLRLRRLARQDVPLERGRPHDLSGSGLLEALGGAPVGLEFRHISISLLFDWRHFGSAVLHGFLRRALAPGLLAQDDVHLVAFLPRHRFGDRLIAEVRDQPLQDAAADLGVRHLAPAEEDRRLDLVAVREEPLDVLLLEVVVVRVDLRPELDLLDLDHPLVFLGLARSLLLLVLVLAEIHDPADRRLGGRRDLDQVEPLLTRDGHRLRRRHDAELLSGLVNHTDFTDTDALVGANAVVTSGRAIECDNVLLNCSDGSHSKTRSTRQRLCSGGRVLRLGPDNTRILTPDLVQGIGYERHYAATAAVAIISYAARNGALG